MKQLLSAAGGIARRANIGGGSQYAKDRKLMHQDDFADTCAAAIAEVLAEFFNQAPPPIKWYRVLVEVARTREGPGTQFRDALQGEARLQRDDVFAGDAVVAGEQIGSNATWGYRADLLGFVSMALLEEDS